MIFPSQSDKIFEAALLYIGLGWPVLFLHNPIGKNLCSCGKQNCSIGKHPRTKHGLNDATTNEEEIRRLLKIFPMTNLGIRTGGSSGFLALDIDPRHGGDETLADLEVRYGKLPDTVENLTGGGGRHVLFKHPGGRIKNSSSNIGPGLDVKADGGYIVVPPSLHPSGQRYCWDVTCHPEDVELADLPNWLLEKIEQNSTAPARSSDYWRNLVMNDILEGHRNNTLTSLAGHLLRRYVDPFVTLNLLFAVNASKVKPPLSEHEVFNLVESVVEQETRRRKAGGAH